jgi:hypothetical protein
MANILMFRIQLYLSFIATSIATLVCEVADSLFASITCLPEAHQGVMTDRRHSLKRGDRLSKKERQTTT